MTTGNYHPKPPGLAQILLCKVQNKFTVKEHYVQIQHILGVSQSLTTTSSAIVAATWRISGMFTVMF
jgi:hypothetical protein